jgi:hypothetical protein
MMAAGHEVIWMKCEGILNSASKWHADSHNLIRTSNGVAQTDRQEPTSRTLKLWTSLNAGPSLEHGHCSSLNILCPDILLGMFNPSKHAV